jgi:hypothetical protein
MTTQATIVDQQQAYPPSQVMIDHPANDRPANDLAGHIPPTDDVVDYVTACEEVRRRHRQDLEDQIEWATTRLVDQLNRQRRRLHVGTLRQAARREVLSQRRRMADQELRGMQPPPQLLEDAERHDDAELHRRREHALAVLLDEETDSYVALVPQVLADRESVCRQQALLVDEQEQLNRQLDQLRGVRGLIGVRRVRQLHAELAELDRQLTHVQGEIRHQQALLDVIQAADTKRSAWPTRQQATLQRGAAAVVVLTRRLLALANPPGCTRPASEVDLDHPMGHDPLDMAAANGTAAPAAEDVGGVLAATAQAAVSPAPPPRQG